MSLKLGLLDRSYKCQSPHINWALQLLKLETFLPNPAACLNEFNSYNIQQWCSNHNGTKMHSSNLVCYWSDKHFSLTISLFSTFLFSSCKNILFFLQKYKLKYMSSCCSWNRGTSLIRLFIVWIVKCTCTVLVLSHNDTHIIFSRSLLSFSYQHNVTALSPCLENRSFAVTEVRVTCHRYINLSMAKKMQNHKQNLF